MMGINIQRLGSTPSPDLVDKYMKTLHYERMVVGTSVQDRDLVVYGNLPLHNNDDRSRDIPTVLFLSLVHGNEPMGLLSLLTTAHALAESSFRLRGSHNQAPVRLLFFPVVNVDGYLWNRQCARGRHRGNMRLMDCGAQPIAYSCDNQILTSPEQQQQQQQSMTMGVDLNRNFPVDWNGTYSADGSAHECDANYRGPCPFSEPETQAIRKLVELYPVVAALSFHSLSDARRGKPLLIHPYTSQRPMASMPPTDQVKFRAWGQSLNLHGLYKVGTAAETIPYQVAGGTTIDWLYTVHNVTAFVLETTPVCDHRWCPATPRLYRLAREYGTVGQRLVELVVHGRVVQDARSMARSLGFMGLIVLGWLGYKWKRSLLLFWRRRVHGKLKDVAADYDNVNDDDGGGGYTGGAESEMQSLQLGRTVILLR